MTRKTKPHRKNRKPLPQTCAVCGVHVTRDKGHFEPRFDYWVCDEHKDTPPARIAYAAEEYRRTHTR